MAQIEFEGKNTEEAIAKACASLALPVEELKFFIITTGSSGIFGLGGRKAKIKVELSDAPAAPALGSALEPLDNPAASVTVEGKKLATVLPPQKPVSVEAPLSKTDSEKTPLRLVAAPGKISETRFPAPKSSEPLNLNGLDIPLPPTQPGPGENIQSGEPDELTRQGLETLARILKLMDFEAQLSAVRITNRIIINVDCQEHGLLIGKKGATLDALQFLLSKMVLKDEEAEVQIIVDIENYRLRRHESIIALAKNMAEKAWRGGRPVVINQLSSPERRVIHMMFKNAPSLRTKSRGDGLFKSLVIIPVGQFDNHGGDESARSHPGDDLNDFQD